MPELEELRIGVFVCHCGLNIASTVDCGEVARFAAELPGVVYAMENRYSCSEPGQQTIRNAIKEHRLNRVVVASCSPRMHELTFRAVLESAGLNKYLLEMVNLREHCSWVHIDHPEEATRKAKDLVAMGVARAALLEPQEEAVVPVKKSVLVIGGGVAGIQSSLDLADAGYRVYLVEKSPSLGGIMARLDKTYPTMDCAI